MTTNSSENLYQFTFDMQTWDVDPYYVGSGAPVYRDVTVIASTKTEALEEGKRLMGSPGNSRYWRFFNLKAVDVRLITKEVEVAE